MIKYSMNFFMKYKLFTILFIIILIISMLLSIATPYFNGYFIDFLITTTSETHIIYFALCLIGLGVLSALFSYISNMITIKLSKMVSYDMIDSLITHVQKIPYNIYSKNYTPVYLIKRIQQDVVVILNFMLANCVQVFSNFISFVITMILISQINASILILNLCVLPIYFIIYSIVKKPYFKKSLEIKEKESMFFHKLFRRIDLILELKTDASYAKDKERSKKHFLDYLTSCISFGRLSYLYLSLDQIISIIFQAAVLIVGGLQIVNHKMTIGQYTILAVYFTNLIKIIAFYFNLGTSIQEAKASYQRVQEIEALPAEPNGDLQLSTIQYITADMVDYSYDKENIHLVLADFTYNFEPNHIYTIVGKNGAGKTTLLHLLTGILQGLENGSITINGEPLDHIDMIHLRQQCISVFLQSTKVDDISVEEFYENELELNPEQMMEAIETNELKELFYGPNFNITNYLNKKINTLSGGERQKVFLLKALLKPSQLLILDEPTNNLDTHATDFLINYIKSMKSNKIIILTSHDSRIKEISDKIIDLENPFF